MNATGTGYILGTTSLRVLGWVVLCLVISPRLPAANPNELGHPIFRDFPPGRTNIGHLCQAIAEDAAGFIHIANSFALRYHDGSNWALINLPSESAGIRKFTVTAKGTIYAGGAGVIGWIRTTGEVKEFVSLVSKLPSPDPDFEDIHDVLAVGETVYFSTENHILIWREDRFTVVPFPTPPHSHGARLHRVGDEVYVTALDHPLGRLEGDRVEAVVDDPVLRNNEIIAINEGKAGALILLTAERFFFKIVSGRITPCEVEANRWLEGRRVICAQRLGDASLVVAFSAPTGDGGMRFDASGRYQGPIDNSLGLYVKTIRAFLPDREGGLWLGTETGMFRLEWPSGFTLFDSNNGLGQGAVVASVRHDGVLFAATTEGVYRLSPSDGAGHVARFERLFGSPIYAMTSHAGGLLAVGYEDVQVFESGGGRPIAKLPPGGGQLTHSSHDPERVWVTTTRGISSIRHTPEGWVEEGLLAGFDESVTALAEVQDGSLQIITSGGQHWRVGFAHGAARPEHFSPEGKDRPLPLILAECAAADGGRWVARRDGIDYLPMGGSDARRLPHLVGAATGAVTHLREESGPAGTLLWISGEKGLIRLEVARAFPPPVPLVLQLYARGLSSGETLAPKPAPLTFGFLALRHQFANTVEYQSRLVGSESQWSTWSPVRERTFANLSAGNYRFEVRARDSDGVLSATSVLGFAVLPPWWATWWAILGYVMASGGVIAGLVHVRTHALHRRTEQLEAVVAIRTAELARKNVELIRLNQLELDEKISARLAEEKARLEVLRYQLNPHFLFNTLASISAALPGEGSTARTMVERLADFCRLTLHRGSDEDWTTLGEEMKLLRAYLEIEQSRWGDLLDVEITEAPELAGERLPHFLLLPLVENALKYGHATSVDRVGLRLAAGRAADGALRLEVANTGEWVEPKAGRSVVSLGIGLDNLRERLVRHYPRAHRLDITHGGGWVTVTLHIISPRAV